MRDLLERLAPDVDVDAAWDEVRDRLDSPRPFRTARVLAVAAAIALVAVAVVLADRAGRGGNEDVPARPGPAHTVTPDVTVEQPEGWRRIDDVLAGGPGGDVAPWPSFAIGTSPLVRNAADSACDQLPVASLERLGPTDALLWVVQPHDAATGEMDGDIEIPGEPVADTDLATCLERLGDFTSDVGTLDFGGSPLIVGLAFGEDAEDRQGDAALVLFHLFEAVEQRSGALDEFGYGQTMAFGPNPADDTPLVRDLLTVFDLPPDAHIDRPARNDGVQSLSGFVRSLAFSAACEWYRYVIDGVDRGDRAQRDAGVAGLLRFGEQIGGTGSMFRSVRDEIARTGDSPTARTEIDLNC